MGPSTIARVVEGNVLFRLRPASSTRLSMPGGVVQSAAVGMSRADQMTAARVSTGTQTQRDALGVITAQRVGLLGFAYWRVRWPSSRRTAPSQNGCEKGRRGPYSLNRPGWFRSNDMQPLSPADSRPLRRLILQARRQRLGMSGHGIPLTRSRFRAGGRR